MNVEYERTIDDHIVFNLFHLAHSPSMKRQQFAMQIVTALLSLGAALGVFYLFERELTFFSYGFSIVAAVASFFLYPPFHRRSVANAVRKMLSEGNNKAILGKERITLSPEGILSTTVSTESTHIWSSIDKIMQSDSHIFMYISAINAFLIPKKAFASAKDQQEFLDYIAKHREP